MALDMHPSMILREPARVERIVRYCTSGYLTIAAGMLPSMI
jgi:hypothetical protein